MKSKLLKRTLLITAGLSLTLGLSACGNQQQSNQTSTHQSKPKTEQSQSQNNNPDNEGTETTAQPIQITNHYLAKNHFKNTPQWYAKHAGTLFRASRHGTPNAKDMISMGSVDNFTSSQNSLDNSRTSINMKYANNKVYMIGWIMRDAHDLWFARQKQYMGDETQSIHTAIDTSHNPNDYKKAMDLYQNGINFAKQHHLKGVSFGGERSNHSLIWQSSKDVEMFRGPTQKVPENLLSKED